MIVPDVNLLIHAYNVGSPVHDEARAWLEGLLSAPAPVGLPWVTTLGFIRITTHPRIMEHPYPAEKACAHVESWLAQPQVTLLHPGERHASILLDLLRRLGTAGNLTTDAHLAALAVEHQAELHSTDVDFGRFPGLRWINPLAD
ncbi:MAG: type II toxin-antitoxin system VapC family toxin [Longimicrobiales bacterium]|nr:type II toxin-antitoxin system VapC family toxin [Longimicrobiales bacterium]